MRITSWSHSFAEFVGDGVKMVESSGGDGIRPHIVSASPSAQVAVDELSIFGQAHNFAPTYVANFCGLHVIELSCVGNNSVRALDVSPS